MRVFVWEYCCDACPDAPQSLRREGRAMRSVVLADFARCPGIEAVTLPECLLKEEEATAFRHLGRSCDWTLVIAPESDGILFDRCRLIEAVGGRLLGPDSAAVRLTGDKWELARRLAQHGVQTPPCELLRPEESPATPFPLVCKPRVGAGSQATFLVRDGKELARCLAEARSEGCSGDLLVQPFLPGRAVSVAFLIGPNGRVALPAAEQHLSEDGRFRYLGGRLPLRPEADDRASRLASLAVASVAGLRGFVGVDLILGETPETDVVIEINPRMTTSYVGLRSIAENNLAAVMLAIASGREVSPLTWKRGPVSFTADGQLFD